MSSQAFLLHTYLDAVAFSPHLAGFWLNCLVIVLISIVFDCKREAWILLLTGMHFVPLCTRFVAFVRGQRKPPVFCPGGDTGTGLVVIFTMLSSIVVFGFCCYDLIRSLDDLRYMPTVVDALYSVAVAVYLADPDSILGWVHQKVLQDRAAVAGRLCSIVLRGLFLVGAVAQHPLLLVNVPLRTFNALAAAWSAYRQCAEGEKRSCTSFTPLVDAVDRLVHLAHMHSTRSGRYAPSRLESKLVGPLPAAECRKRHHRLAYTQKLDRCADAWVRLAFPLDPRRRFETPEPVLSHPTIRLSLLMLLQKNKITFRLIDLIYPAALYGRTLTDLSNALVLRLFRLIKPYSHGHLISWRPLGRPQAVPLPDDILSTRRELAQKLFGLEHRSFDAEQDRLLSPQELVKDAKIQDFLSSFADFLDLVKALTIPFDTWSKHFNVQLDKAREAVEEEYLEQKMQESVLPALPARAEVKKARESRASDGLSGARESKKD
ncbi:hypothetical protein JCM10213_004829 [Rhodosporidiobolus nylandii]